MNWQAEPRQSHGTSSQSWAKLTHLQEADLLEGERNHLICARLFRKNKASGNLDVPDILYSVIHEARHTFVPTPSSCLSFPILSNPIVVEALEKSKRPRGCRQQRKWGQTGMMPPYKCPGNPVQICVSLWLYAFINEMQRWDGTERLLSVQNLRRIRLKFCHRGPSLLSSCARQAITELWEEQFKELKNLIKTELEVLAPIFTASHS